MNLNDYIFEVISSIRSGVDKFNEKSPVMKAEYPTTIEFELNSQDFGEARGLLIFKVNTHLYERDVQKLKQKDSNGK